MSVCHIITGLGTGGAEHMLLRLLETSPDKHTVISLTGAGELEPLYKAAGVDIIHVPLKGFTLPFQLTKLFRTVKKLNPAVIVGWMYHGNIAASLAGKYTGKTVVWNVRHSIHNIQKEKTSVQLLVRMGRGLSKHTQHIVYNSEVARQQHTALGFDDSKSVVLPNGINIEQFAPSKEHRVLYKFR